MAYLKLVPALFLVVLVHVGAMAAAIWAVSGPPREVSIGFGPALRRFRVRGVVVVVRLVPLGGYVQFWRKVDDPPPPPGTRLFEERPAVLRAAAQLAGPAALLAAGSVLASAPTWRPALDGAVDLFRGALAPTQAGADLVGEAVGVIRIQPFFGLLALLFFKVAGWNLLPVPSLNGGAALVDLLVPRGPRSERFRVFATVVGQILLLAVMAAWVVAIVTFARR